MLILTPVGAGMPCVDRANDVIVSVSYPVGVSRIPAAERACIGLTPRMTPPCTVYTLSQTEAWRFPQNCAHLVVVEVPRLDR